MSPERGTLPAAHPFDTLAADYDDEFTRSQIGRFMRAAVWDRIDRRFHPGHRVLELNCGTGEDAVHLGQRGVSVLATDVSSEMITAASAKVARHGLAEQVQVRRFAWEDLGTLADSGFDGFLSNFGGINCVDDVASLVQPLARCLKPGATGFICAMGPYSIWEWFWFLAHGSPRKAFRRLTPGGAEWRGLRIHYPSAGQLTRTLSPSFRVVSSIALGTLLAPPFAASLASRFPGAIERLNRWERRFEGAPILTHLADHYLLELERL